MKVNNSPITHIIFDLDGLLLNTVPIYDEMMRTIVVRHGHSYSDALRASLRGRNRRDCAEMIVRHCAGCLTVDECLNQLTKQHARKLPNCQLMPGAERLIWHLHRHGYPMAIGTSSSVQSVALKTKGHEELFGLMHHVICGTDNRVGNGKPAPDIFLVTAGAFGDPVPEPSQCLVFEDALNGVKAARAADMQAVYVADPLDVPTLEEDSTAFIEENAEIWKKRWRSGVLVIDSLLNFKPELFGLPPFESDSY
ncbi:pseudouridine-5'-monophosphatase-like [Tropilaelaps mercedesae]|uniref:Pseudouridine-5'-monophosphatase-like n=1 Tax=Tropilaelaps mercedesae TaxID=418985 RepID=A0A1V9XNL2_9ACAR|nr:pseudouridine-5'-monophosphatase-like [Tropilaelaps mercedesae]